MLKLLWQGPRKAPVPIKLTELPKLIKNFKLVAADLDENFPVNKNSSAMEMDFKCKNYLDFAQRYTILKEARMGEYPSYLMHSNARSLAKLAAVMANKGTLAD